MFIIIRIFFLVLLAVALVFTFRYMLGGNPRHLKYAIRTLLGIVVLGVLLGLAVIFVPNPPESESPEKTSTSASASVSAVTRLIA
jgi:cell shape-determining protein MreD